MTGQDMWVFSMLGEDIKNGYFLNLGAADGVEGDNTFFFEKIFDWKGICVDPSPANFVKLKKNRKCIISNEAISDNNDVKSFGLKGGGHRRSHIITEDNTLYWPGGEDEWQKVRKKIGLVPAPQPKVHDIIKIKCITPNLFLKKI